uniref:Uncharacterized protein n=1 Tax=Kalanchoe fedtschenkoi TaxID=63787 RepID=A0A7N0VN81_KALFE
MVSYPRFRKKKKIAAWLDLNLHPGPVIGLIAKLGLTAISGKHIPCLSAFSYIFMLDLFSSYTQAECNKLIEISVWLIYYV